MLNYNKTFILLLVTVVFLSSCKESEYPVESIARAVGVQANDKVPPCFIRICNWSRLEKSYYSGNLELSKNQYVWAYLSDGTQFVDPKTVYLNNQPLKKLEVGQYQYYKHYSGNSEGANKTCCLTIGGLENESFNIIGSIDDEIVFKNLDYLDTLDLSKGINIEYVSPRYGNDAILVDLQCDYFDKNDVMHYYRLRLNVKDNRGSVHVPAEMLKELPVSEEGARLAGCIIELNRRIPTIENVKTAAGNNILVGKVYETSLVTHVYLKRS